MVKENKQLINDLLLYRIKIYPNGCPTIARGDAKTYLYLSHLLNYISFDICVEQLNQEIEKRDFTWCQEFMKNWCIDAWKKIGDE